MPQVKESYNMRAAAHAYHAKGFHPIPLGGDKRPLGKWAQYQDGVTLDALEAMPWEKAQGVAGIGGIAGLVAVDFDKITDGEIVARFLRAAGLPFDYWWVVETPGGGAHVWVVCPEWTGTKIDFPGDGAAAVELRGARHYTALPPSLHPTGGRYCFRDAPNAGACPPFPPSLLTWEALAAGYYAVVVEEEKASSQLGPVASDGGPVEEEWARARVAGALRIVERAGPKTRNKALNTAAHTLGGLVAAGELDEAEAVAQLTAAGLAVGQKPGETQSTIKSGLSSGKLKPLPTTPKKRQRATTNTNGTGPGRTVDSQTGEIVEDAHGPQAGPGGAFGADVDSAYLALETIIESGGDVSTLAGEIGRLPRSQHGQIRALLVAAGWTKTDAGTFVRECVADAKARRREEKAAAASVAVAEWREDAIETTNRPLRDLHADAVTALQRHNAATPQHPAVFVRGGALARVATDENRTHSIALLGEGTLRLILSQAADWIAVSTNDETGQERARHVSPPREVLQSLLGVGNPKGIPPIDGIVSAPVVGPGGIIHDVAGYNPATRLYFAQNGLQLGDTTPQAGAVGRALAVLDELLQDFPFADAASKAHALGLLFLGFVRPMIDGPTPLHLIDSPTPGTGKGLLAGACTLPAMGPYLPSTSAGRDDDEWRKRLTAALVGGGNVINIDNVTTTLDSGALASALTQPVWEDRILGLSQTVQIRIRNAWIATGNNTQLSQEISRRAVWIRLDANAEKPWEREGFRHPDLLGWASANRAALATAALTVIRGWIEAGMMPYAGRPKSSYTAWAQVIGGILEYAKIPGFLANESDLYDVTVKGRDGLGEFVKAWAARFPVNQDTPTADLFRLASYPDIPTAGEWLGLLDDELGAGNQKSRQTKLGRLLARNRDNVIEGYKIERGTTQSSGHAYKLTKAIPFGL